MISPAAKRLASLAGVFGFVAVTSLAADTVNFSRDVLPIISDNCLSCHGPDEKHRKAGLRLDLREAATADNKGVIAIVPGKPAASELIKRITTTDTDDLMPPPESHKPRLSTKQVATLQKWISEGAKWGKHWAFEPPAKTAVPKGKKHPVDAFVNARLQQEKLKLAPLASRATLIRRASFDLTGLPPTPAEVDAFVNDKSPDAWEKVVKRLLASEHFGERMAMWWLDAARYSDTDGFQSDDTRTNWPWRDWVIDAFNRNQPFDQFTTEQFAGDLLPNATPEQKLATCFHRNHMTNGEGGRDPEESRVDYVLDRVNTVGTVWLGLTLGCAQCHSHKFDPISHADYYSLTAFFNSVDEDGKAGKGAKPYLSYESARTQRAIDEAQKLVDERKPREVAARAEAQKPFIGWLAERDSEVRKGFTAWQPLKGAVESSEGTILTQESDAIIQASGPNLNQDDYRLYAPVKLSRITGLRLEIFPNPAHSLGAYSFGKSGEFLVTDIKVQTRRKSSSQIADIAVKNAAADYSAPQSGSRAYGDIKGVLDDDPRNGWTAKGAPSNVVHTAVFALAEPLVLAPDEELIFELRHRSTLGDANTGRYRISATDQNGPAVMSVDPMPLEQLRAANPPDLASLEPKLRERLFEQFLADYAPYQQAKAALDRANAQLGEAKGAKKVNVMVLAEREKPRDTFVLVRGVWDKHGDQVQRNVPAAIADWPAAAGRDRLGFAQWVVSKQNPLTARVVVNHLWQLAFGNGLVRTPEDFGLQGERPSHPELLDYLAVEFMESGWDVKQMLTHLLTSETYRQDSAVSAALLARDPDNKLLARGPRFRLPSWMLRDASLRYAGLLNPALGGPPVKPYQPEGIWEENFMGRFKYVPSEGAAQYRRSLYAFWRRSSAPTFLFDSAQRRVCEVRTPRTNTPLQALTLLNDETYLEASRALATQMLATNGSTRDRIRVLYRQVLSRTPTDRENDVLTRELERALAHYKSNPGNATKFLTRGQSPFDPKLNASELAAHTVVASLVLNLDETITHE